MRERDIRQAIQGALQATGAFSDVWLTGLPESYGQGASVLAAAAVEPGSTRRLSGWDAAPDGGCEYAAMIRLTVLQRHPDPQLRDEAAEDLLNIAIDAIDGQALAPGLTVPQKTAVGAWDWLDANPPERRIRATVQVHYLVPWGDFDTSA